MGVRPSMGLRMEQSGFRAEDGRKFQGASYGWPLLDNLARVAAQT